MHFDSFPFRHWELDNRGNLRYVAPIARTGYLTYYDREGQPVELFVPESTLIDSLDSFKTKPITMLHPTERVTPKNARKYSRGLTGYTGFFDGKFLWLTGTVTDEELIKEITSGNCSEISPGYDALLERTPKRITQLKRDGEHVAAVPKGRNGSEVAFKMDSNSKDSDSKDSSFSFAEDCGTFLSFSCDEDPVAPKELEEHYRDPRRKIIVSVPRTFQLISLGVI